MVSFNLRPALASVGPLITEIRNATGLTSSLLGLLTTLPLLCFGILSTMTPWFTRKIGLEGTVAFALLLITGGLLIRVPGTVPHLYAGTFLIGVGIALGNVLLPGIVKRDFEKYSGIMTSIYSSMLGVGAAVAAGISFPLAIKAGLGWRWSLGIWFIPAFLAFIVWIPQLKRNRRSSQSKSVFAALKHLSGSKMAWSIALFMGLQSFAFYVILAWLPDILISEGFNAGRAGWLLSVSQAAGVIGSFIIPAVAERMKSQRSLVLGLSVLEAVSIIGLMNGTESLVLIMVILIGFSLGGSFGLALLFIVLRTNDTETTTELSGMSQSVGYLLAAFGPMMMGAFYDISGSWTIPLAMLLFIVMLKCFFGIYAGNDQKIDRNNQQ
ncbi:CynX/NimT family MFS transporter [Balneola sp. MJW-20]|uniref:CynX/NimT family MFS transporter n=1 Tax=Gracilimonas aurantiaca TaxID=3234185 RepID=UPI003467819F